MRRLSGELEHLDGPLQDQATLAGNLADLARINRRFGGTALSIRAMRALLAAGSAGASATPGLLRVLDVGTGAADIPLALVRAKGPWQDIHVRAVDSRPEVIDAARAINPRLVAEPRIELAVADGGALPNADGAFDVAHASLVLHHLEPEAAIPFLRELRRVARVGVVINDLQRGRLEWLGAWVLLHVMTRNGFTLHDGPMSVRRAYTRREARELLGKAGLEPVFERSVVFGHRWAIAAVPR